jgi:hypothetical protein
MPPWKEQRSIARHQSNEKSNIVINDASRHAVNAFAVPKVRFAIAET